MANLMESLVLLKPSELDQLIAQSVARSVGLALKTLEEDEEPKPWLTTKQVMEYL